MSAIGARILAFLAGLSLLSSLVAQETYHERTTSALDRRAKNSMAQFQSSLSGSKLTGDHSKGRVLLSFSHLVPASEVVENMLGLGIEIEDLQISVGETVSSFSIDSGDPMQAVATVRAQLDQFIARKEQQTKWLLANETLAATRHWLLEDLHSIEAFQSRVTASDELSISGVGCIASNEEIEALLATMPSVIRAIENQGTLRIMSMPVETHRGSDE